MRLHTPRKFCNSFFFSLLIFLSALSTAGAQVLNVESFRTATAVDSAKTWAGETGFDFTLSKFNDRVIKLGNQTVGSYFTGRDRYLFVTNLELVDVDGESVVSNGYFHLRGTFFEPSRFSPEFFNQFQYNENLGLKERFLTGGSLRYRFLQNEVVTGSLVTGLMYEYEKWGTDTISNIRNNLIKSTTSLSLRGQISENARLVMIGYYQARPDRFFRPRVTSENQLNIHISRHAQFRVNFTLTYDADPVIDIPDLIFELKNGLVLTF
ncbi:MAG: DUF481 domain-containing protein [Balneolaceae bacterium]